MKLLMIYTDRFNYKTTTKGLDAAKEISEEKSFEDVIVGFIHFEESDEKNLSNVETKMIKQLKWAARKNGTENIILHSFAHLSESKGSPEKAKLLFDNAEKRLTTAGYNVSQTPFGYFLDLNISAPGKSLARIYKNI